MHLNTGLSQAGRGFPQFLAKQLTLSQLGGRLCPPQYYKPPRIFKPCDGPGIVVPLTCFNIKKLILVPNKRKMYNTVILLLFVFKLTESVQLPYCPEVVNPNPPHSLTRPIILHVTKLRLWKPVKGNILFI